MITSFMAFLGVSAIVIMTPGPDTAVTVRNTLLGGRVAGILTALGISTGQAIWALATSFGVVALLVASEVLFQAVKYAGAAYLIYLGLHALIGAWRGGDGGPAAARVDKARLGPGKAFLQGLMSDLGNPKMAVFFASLLPQFATPGEGLFAALMSLGLVFSLLTFLWLAVYAFVIAKAGEVLRRRAIRRWIEGVTGTLLVALGVRIAAEQR
ncbi:LysE family translocator [Dongia deserti]|uniref:LysE family translocator n=1 Tax=Dongia deserti TaxID=2268030 RepID=UPI002547E1BE|nr:LysE family translocator [Dongia deserti]